MKFPQLGCISEIKMETVILAIISKYNSCLLVVCVASD